MARAVDPRPQADPVTQPGVRPATISEFVPSPVGVSVMTIRSSARIRMHADNTAGYSREFVVVVVSHICSKKQKEDGEPVVSKPGIHDPTKKQKKIGYKNHSEENPK